VVEQNDALLLCQTDARQMIERRFDPRRCVERAPSIDLEALLFGHERRAQCRKSPRACL